MSTKSELTTLVDDNIRNKTPKVLKDEHADVEQAIVDEVYGSVITETQSSHAITTPEGTSGRNYNIKLVKQGRIVFGFGSVTNSSGSTMNAGAEFFDFDAGDYYPDGNAIQFEAFKPSTQTSVELAIALDVFKLNVGSLSIGETARFQFFYYTQD